MNVLYRMHASVNDTTVPWQKKLHFNLSCEFGVWIEWDDKKTGAGKCYNDK